MMEKEERTETELGDLRISGEEKWDKINHGEGKGHGRRRKQKEEKQKTNEGQRDSTRGTGRGRGARKEGVEQGETSERAQEDGRGKMIGGGSTDGVDTEKERWRRRREEVKGN